MLTGAGAGAADRRPGGHLLHPPQRRDAAGAGGRRKGGLRLRHARRHVADAAGMDC